MSAPRDRHTSNAHLSRHGKRFNALVAQAERRNFKLGVSNGVLYGLGVYFISKSTVIPSFLSHLTHSSALIGIVSQFESIGWYLPQLLVSSFLVHRPQKMPVYRFATVIRAVGFFGLAAVAFWNPSSIGLLWLSIAMYGLFTMGSGIGGIAFMELLAKAIPAHRRGRFLGLRISITAILSATIGALLVASLLSSAEYPRNFAYVFLVGAVIATAGLILMAIMREPRTLEVPAERSILDQLREGWSILRRDRRYREYVEARLIMATWTVGVPFLVLFGQSHLGFSTSAIGVFIAADCAGTIIGNFFWERLADKRSTKACLQGAAALSIVLPIVILLYLFLPVPRFFYPVVFGIASAVDAGTSIGGMSHLIEISPERERSTYIGLFNSLMAFPCILTAAAGLLLDLTGYGLVYSIVLMLAVGSLVALRKLEVFRHGVAVV